MYCVSPSFSETLTLWAGVPSTSSIPRYSTRCPFSRQPTSGPSRSAFWASSFASSAAIRVAVRRPWKGSTVQASLPSNACTPVSPCCVISARIIPGRLSTSPHAASPFRRAPQCDGRSTHPGLGHRQRSPAGKALRRSDQSSFAWAPPKAAILSRGDGPRQMEVSDQIFQDQDRFSRLLLGAHGQPNLGSGWIGFEALAQCRQRDLPPRVAINRHNLIADPKPGSGGRAVGENVQHLEALRGCIDPHSGAIEDVPLPVVRVGFENQALMSVIECDVESFQYSAADVARHVRIDEGPLGL